MAVCVGSLVMLVKSVNGWTPLLVLDGAMVKVEIAAIFANVQLVTAPGEMVPATADATLIPVIWLAGRATHVGESGVSGRAGGRHG